MLIAQWFAPWPDGSVAAAGSDLPDGEAVDPGPASGEALVVGTVVGLPAVPSEDALGEEESQIAVHAPAPTRTIATIVRISPQPELADLVRPVFGSPPLTAVAPGRPGEMGEKRVG